MVSIRNVGFSGDRSKKTLSTSKKKPGLKIAKTPHQYTAATRNITGLAKPTTIRQRIADKFKKLNPFKIEVLGDEAFKKVNKNKSPASILTPLTGQLNTIAEHPSQESASNISKKAVPKTKESKLKKLYQKFIKETHEKYHIPREEALTIFNNAAKLTTNSTNQNNIKLATEILKSNGRNVLDLGSNKGFLVGRMGVPNSDKVRLTKEFAHALKKADNNKKKISKELNKYLRNLKNVNESKNTLTGFIKATIDSFGGFIKKRVF